MKPSFRNMICDLTSFLSLGIVVITETCILGNRARAILRHLSFDDIHTTYDIGYASGIQLCWHKDIVDLEVLSATEQEIQAIVKVHNLNFSWLLSSIYASPKFEEMKALWENLYTVASLHSLLWSIIGDFNDVLTDSEKSEENHVDLRRTTA